MLNNGGVPDIIILETKMQGMTGRELSDKLKENPTWKDMPMMFFTAWKDRFEDNSGFSGDDHIEKPFDMRDLKTRADTTMRRVILSQDL